MSDYLYHWLHIPSGQTGIKVQSFPYRRAFLESLAKWNASNPGVWQYWEA